jgi:glycosyltransferase involved in cell wall biosynthesis
VTALEQNKKKSQGEGVSEMSGTGPLALGIVLHDLSLGGTERIALRLARHWARAGARVTVFCGSRKGELLELLCPSVNLVEAPVEIERGSGSRERLGEAAARYFNSNPVDVCFVPGNFHWPVVPALARLPAQTRPVIVAQVSAALDKPQRGPLRQAMFELRMRYRLRGADGVVCMSERARDQANQILGRNVAFRIATPALDDDMLPPTPVPPDCRMLVAAGRLVREKGFSTLIEAVALVDDPALRLVIVGKGPDEQRLRQQIAALGMGERISLPGYSCRIRPWLDQARAFVLSSQYEGFPAVVIEALAAGRQVIVTRCTHAVRDLGIDGAMGQAVPIEDPAALAQAIRAMLARPPTDPVLLANSVAAYRIGPIAEDYLLSFRRWLALRPRAAVSAAAFAAHPAAAPPARTALVSHRSM